MGMRHNFARLVLLPLVAAALAGCAETPEGKRDVYARVLAEMDRCAEAHGYRRAEYLALGPYELAPGEAAWRACVYDGIARELMPAAVRPEAYRELIETDRRLTAGIAAGRVSRAERERRVGDLLARIEVEEETARQARLRQRLEATKDQEEHQRLIEEIERRRRHASEMRQRLRAR